MHKVPLKKFEAGERAGVVSTGPDGQASRFVLAMRPSGTAPARVKCALVTPIRVGDKTIAATACEFRLELN